MNGETVKIRLEFDGWYCLSKFQIKEILNEARQIFSNANFFENSGILVETRNEADVSIFCFAILKKYANSLRNWDGYRISRISKKIFLNFADRKRKLQFEYFKKLIIDNTLDDVKILLAGNLYLEPDEVIEILISIQRELNNTFRQMNDEDLKKAYRILLMQVAQKERKFSLHAINTENSKTNS